jgi:hypothetical protein
VSAQVLQLDPRADTRGPPLQSGDARLLARFSNSTFPMQLERAKCEMYKTR